MSKNRENIKNMRVSAKNEYNIIVRYGEEERFPKV